MKDKKIVDDPLEMLFGSSENTTPVSVEKYGSSDVSNLMYTPDAKATELMVLAHIKGGGTVAIVPKDSKAIIVSQEFNSEIKKRIDEVSIELKSIGVIIDQDSAAKANAILKKAKQLVKTLSEERKLMTSVLDEEKKSIMNYEEKIIGLMNKMIEFMNTKITDFQKAELKKQQEKEAALKKQRDAELAESNRKATIQQKILSFENSVIAAISTANINDIDEKIKRLESMKVTSEIYMEFLPEATQMYQRCVTAMTNRKAELVHLSKLEKENKEQADTLRAQQDKNLSQVIEDQKEKMSIVEEVKQNEIANSQMGYEFKVSSGEKIKGIQQKWTFDTGSIDMAILPDEYKTFDEKKIKEAIAAGRKEIPGVRIYQDVVNVSR